MFRLDIFYCHRSLLFLLFSFSLSTENKVIRLTHLVNHVKTAFFLIFVQFLCKQNFEEKEENSSNSTPLRITSSEGHLNRVKYLSEHCTNSEAKTNKEETPLHFACQEDRWDIVKFLVETQNVNKDAKNENENTQLFYANQNNHMRVVEYLMETTKLFLQNKKSN